VQENLRQKLASLNAALASDGCCFVISRLMRQYDGDENARQSAAGRLRVGVTLIDLRWTTHTHNDRIGETRSFRPAGQNYFMVMEPRRSR